MVVSTPEPPLGESVTRPPASPRRNLRSLVLVAVILAGLGFILVRGLGNATLFFYNADEAVAKHDELGERRFRLQGNVDGDSIVRTDAGVDFAVRFNGVAAPVRHQGDLPQLFQADIPVVLEGRWVGARFESDRMLVKHSEVYTAKNPDRVNDYETPNPTGGR